MTKGMLGGMTVKGKDATGWVFDEADEGVLSRDHAASRFLGEHDEGKILDVMKIFRFLLCHVSLLLGLCQKSLKRPSNSG